MKIIEERQFDYIPDRIFKKLSKRDKDNLRSYRSSYRWYKDNDDKLKSLENEILRRKEKKKQYVTELTKKNKELDHLRKDYQFSWSVSRLKNKGDYYNFTISRRQYNTKTGTLGSPKNIKEQLTNCLFYKNDDDKKKQIQKDWKSFLRKEMNDNNSKVRLLIMDMIMKDVTLKKVPLNRKSLFPLTKKDYPQVNNKGVSIPLMMTNKMRWELNHLGYSKDDIKKMTPKEGWEIITKNISK
tara:strand:- start:2868 stop:3587 length:720 start_codon:yes stop_codon:yes gene_type:complete